MTATSPPADGTALDLYRAAAAAIDILARRTQPRAATWRLSPADHVLLLAELAGLALHVGTVIIREAPAAADSTGGGSHGWEAGRKPAAAGDADMTAERLREAHAAVTREVSLIRAAGHPAGACSATLPKSLTAACHARAALQALAEAPDRPGLPARTHLQIITLIQQILHDLAAALGHEAILCAAALGDTDSGETAAHVSSLLISARHSAGGAARSLHPVHSVLQVAADSQEDPQ